MIIPQVLLKAFGRQLSLFGKDENQLDLFTGQEKDGKVLLPSKVNPQIRRWQGKDEGEQTPNAKPKVKIKKSDLEIIKQVFGDENLEGISKFYDDIIELFPYAQYTKNDGTIFKTIGASKSKGNYFYLLAPNNNIYLEHNMSGYPATVEEVEAQWGKEAAEGWEELTTSRTDGSKKKKKPDPADDKKWITINTIDELRAIAHKDWRKDTYIHWATGEGSFAYDVLKRIKPGNSSDKTLKRGVSYDPAKVEAWKAIPEKPDKVKNHTDMLNYCEHVGKYMELSPGIEFNLSKITEEQADRLEEWLKKDYKKDDLPISPNMALDKAVQYSIYLNAKGKPASELSLFAYATREFINEAKAEFQLMSKALWIPENDYKLRYEAEIEKEGTAKEGEGKLFTENELKETAKEAEKTGWGQKLEDKEKEPHEMTQEEIRGTAHTLTQDKFIKDSLQRLAKKRGGEAFQEHQQRQKTEFEVQARIAHRNYIEQALKEGNKVPTEVLENYPDLKTKIETKPANVNLGKQPYEMTKKEYVTFTEIKVAEQMIDSIDKKLAYYKDIFTQKIHGENRLKIRQLEKQRQIWADYKDKVNNEGVENFEKNISVLTHKAHIGRALQEGKKVAPEVLQDYPDFALFMNINAPAETGWGQKSETNDGDGNKRGIDSEEGKAISEQIYKQIGRQAFYMLGAYNFSYDRNGSLGFRIKGSPHYKYIKIKYDKGSDLYSIEFTKAHGLKITAHEEVDGVYADKLHEIIESKTGLYTSLGTLGREGWGQKKEGEQATKGTEEKPTHEKEMRQIFGEINKIKNSMDKRSSNYFSNYLPGRGGSRARTTSFNAKQGQDAELKQNKERALTKLMREAMLNNERIPDEILREYKTQADYNEEGNYDPIKNSNWGEIV